MKRLLFVLICLCLVQVSQAVIIKCQAEDTRLITDAGNNWSTRDQETALGGKYITATLNITTLAEERINYYRFRAPAGNYTLYIRYTKNNNDGQQAFTNDSFFCSDSSFALTASMAERNNTPQNGLNTAAGGTVDSHQVYAWCLIDTANSYVQAADGVAYFKIAPREDGWRFDAFAFVSQGETVNDDIMNAAPNYEPYAAYDPFVTPENADGSFGTPVLVGSDWKVSDLTFHFSAGEDPAGVAPLNPDIVKHNVYLQKGAPADPNFYLIGSVNQTSPTDPAQSIGPLSALTPAVSLAVETTYLWKVEEVLDNGAGGYPAGDPNNVLGPAWSFETAGLTPEITSISDHMLTDSNGDTSFTIEATIVANNFKWFKVVGVQDSAGGESDDIQLTDTGIYSGTATKTLTINGAASNGDDDAQVYAIAYNGTTPSEPSAARWFWYPRLVNSYAFETMSVVDGNNVTPDAVSGFDMTMLSNDIGADIPTLETNIPAAPGIAGNTKSLKLNNPRAVPADPNNGDAQYAQVNEQWAGSYKDITVSMWVYSRGSSNWNRMLDFGNDTDNYMMICTNVNADDNDAVRFEVKSATVAQNITTGNTALPDNEWTLVTATLSGDTARIYINGEWVVSGSITNNPIDYGPTTQNWIGRSMWGSGDGYFNGSIDELKIWNYGLSGTEVGQEYLADTLQQYICDTENNDLGVYDFNHDCLISLPDFAELAVRWLEDDRIHAE